MNFRLRTRRGPLLVAAALTLGGCATLAPGGSAPAEPLVLLDGGSLEGWEHVGPGGFVSRPDGSIEGEGGMGLLYYAERPFRDFVLELDWLAAGDSTNSGVYLRIPEKPADPQYAVDHGYEIQIYRPATKQTYEGATGAVYSFASAFRDSSRPVGEWNRLRVEVRGQHYQVFLNGDKVNEFFGDRALEGYIGLQNHDSRSPIRFRDIRVTPLSGGAGPEHAGLAEHLAVREEREPIRVLMVTTTHGFRHKEAIPASIEMMREIAETTEFEVDATEELGALTAENLARYDVLFLANATLGLRAPKEEADTAAENLVSAAQRRAIAEFVRRGGGLAVAHAGLDAFYRWPEYREMVGGGLFQEHPWTQQVRIDVEDPDHPTVQHLGDHFWIRDEIYVLDRNPRWKSHVLLSLDLPSVRGDSMSADATRDDYPISWVRRYGEGRVFATKLGHFADLWRNPDFVRHVLQGLRVAAGRLDAETGGHRVKETIAENVWPDDLAVDERGNVWIAELTGKVHLYDAATKRTRLVGEVRTTDPEKIEHGLYGVEVDPEFYAGQPYVYLYYAEPETFVNTLARYRFQDGRIDMGSGEVILRVPTDPQCCHQAGDLEWGPDATLFVSTGDTGQSGTKPEQELPESRIQGFVRRNDLTGYHWSRLADSERTSQNLQSLRGKVLRINRDGSIPKDNPFYGEPGVRWEIYAYGLRNPYRIQYDDETGRLLIGIVGPDEQTTYDWYDISTQVGENFGWPRATGRLFYNEWTPEMIQGYVPPAWEYTYATGSRSASGGPVYRASGPKAFPEVFQGKWFVYDGSRAWIKYGDIVAGTFRNDTTEDVKATEDRVEIPALRLTNVKTFDVLEGTRPISMELGPDGCLYVAEFTGFWGPAEGSKVSRYCWKDEPAPVYDAAAGGTQATR